jgi:hypothetical protein
MTVEFRNRTAFEEIISFRTSHVVFFLLALEKHVNIFNAAISHLAHHWGDQFRISSSITAH